MCKGLLLCGRLDLADGRNDDLRNLVNIEFGRIDGEVIIREVVPALIRVEVVVIRSLSRFVIKSETFFSSHAEVAYFCYGRYGRRTRAGCRLAASDDDARAFIRSRLDDVALKNEQLIIDMGISLRCR